MRATVWVPPLTHTESNPTVTPHGPSGTASVVTTSFVAGSMPTTSFCAYELIQTRPRPSATSHGVGTVSIEATARSSAAGPAAAEPAGDAAGDATGSVDATTEGAARETRRRRGPATAADHAIAAIARHARIARFVMSPPPLRCHHDAGCHQLVPRSRMPTPPDLVIVPLTGERFPDLARALRDGRPALVLVHVLPRPRPNVVQLVSRREPRRAP